jgi:hypothetical protein
VHPANSAHAQTGGIAGVHKILIPFSKPLFLLDSEIVLMKIAEPNSQYQQLPAP